LKPLTSIVAILAALAVILGLSLASAVREQGRLTDDFTVATRQQVHASVEALSARLDALDQDTRMLTDLIERSGGEGDLAPSTEKRIWEGAFRAMAVVVPQYRTIALVDADGSFQVLASDPSETADTVQALMPHTRRLALEVAARHDSALGETARYGDRSFLLYGTPVRGGRAIVVASDAAIFLGAVAWTSLPSARLFVTDPAGVVWSGCETAGGCRATPPDAMKNYLDVKPPPPSQLTGRGARVVRPARIPAVQVSERVDRPTGSWVVTWLASTQAIVERERSMVSRVVLTAMAAAVAVAAVGAVLLRQQRKAVELEGRLRYAQALASARETSQSIVDHAPLGVLGVSHDGRVMLANGFLTDRLGPVRVGAALRDAFPRAGAQWFRDIEPLLAGERGVADPSAHRELHSIVAGAHQFLVRIVPVHSHELGVRTFALLEDQSELRNLEQQLVRAEKLITVGVLSAGIAHEIGSPLAVIRGRAEQVLRTVVTGPRAEDLRVIIKHIDNIASTIRQVLDFSRKKTIERQPVSLDAIVERARALLGWKLEGKHLQVDVVLEERLPRLAADPDQLEQVLVNLLLNACDASSERARVRVSARRSSREGPVEIRIADQGNGIAAEHMNAVFDPFFTTKKRGEGTGLGLPIAASIVRDHGGRIDLVSTPGKGTTVTVTWPAAEPPVRENRASEERSTHA
jgi:two-component system sensor histidine kinase HydH